MRPVSVSVTLQVPVSVYRLAQRTAKMTSRPIEQVFVDVIAAASPVSDDLPSELQAELETLAQLDDAELWQLARRTFSPAGRKEYDRLLQRNSAGSITVIERERLKELRLESERLMLHKAYAYSLLKWRGHTLPPLTKLPRPR